MPLTSINIYYRPDKKLSASEEHWIHEAQKLRYAVFAEECSPDVLLEQLTNEQRQKKREWDNHDTYADILAVIAHEEEENPHESQGSLVGCYRAIRQEAVEEKEGRNFYSSAEFDWKNVLNKRREVGNGVVELSRACIHPDFRKHGVLQKLLGENVNKLMVDKNVITLIGAVSIFNKNFKNNQAPYKKIISYLQNDLGIDENMAIKLQKPTKTTPNSQLPPSLEPVSKEEVKKIFREIGESLLRMYANMFSAQFGDVVYYDPIFDTYDLPLVVPAEEIAPQILSKMDKSGALQETISNILMEKNSSLETQSC